MFSQLKQNYFKVVLSTALVMIALFFGTRLVGVPSVFAQDYVDTTKTTEGDKGGFVLCGNTAKTPCTIGHLFAAFIVIINYLIAMAGFIAVAAIVFAGFMMIYSQGQEQLKTAKSRLSGAIIGLVLVAAAYLLINSLISGRFSIGVCDDKLILTSPLEYIQNYNGCKGASSGTNTNTIAIVNANTNTNTGPKVDKFLQAMIDANPGGDAEGEDVGGTLASVYTCEGTNTGFNLKNLFVKTANAQSCPILKTWYNTGETWGYLQRQDPYSNPNNPNHLYGNCPSDKRPGTIATLEEAGCGVVATSMVLSSVFNENEGRLKLTAGSLEALETNPNAWRPDNLAKYFVAAGYRLCGNGSLHKGPSAVMKVAFDPTWIKASFSSWDGGNANPTKHLTKSAEDVDSIVNTIRGSINNDGYAIIVVGKKAPWTMKGHFVVAYDIDDDYRGSGKTYVKIADPYAVTDVRVIEGKLLGQVTKSINYIWF